MTHPDPIWGAFVGGFLTAGFLVIALFFLRFWRRTRDNLFAAFAVAFTLLALNHALVILLGVPDEQQSSLYLIRLTAFLLLIIAILRKNVEGGE